MGALASACRPVALSLPFSLLAMARPAATKARHTIKSLPPHLLVSDFDSTLSSHDSVSQLISLSPVALADGAKVDAVVSAYLADYAEVPQLLAAGALEAALERYAQLEHASLDRVEAAQLLRGVSAGAIAEGAHVVEIREGVAEALRAAADAGVEVHVCSANWSKRWIRCALGDAAEALAGICCNELHVEAESGLSSGGLQRQIVTADDKLAAFERLRAKRPSLEPPLPPRLPFPDQLLTRLCPPPPPQAAAPRVAERRASCFVGDALGGVNNRESPHPSHVCAFLYGVHTNPPPSPPP